MRKTKDFPASPSRQTERPAGTDWLTRLDWKQRTAGKLLQAAQAGNAADCAALLSRSWKLRKKHLPLLAQLAVLLPGPLPEFKADASDPAANSLLEFVMRRRSNSDVTRCRPMLELLARSENGEPSPWQESVGRYLVLRLAGPALEVETLLTLSQRALASVILQRSPRSFSAGGLEQLVTSAELPILSSTTFPDLKGSDKRFQAGLKQWRSWLAEQLDPAGVPLARWLPQLPQILASIARCTLSAALAGEDLWDRQDRKRLRQLVQSILALGSPGRLAFADESNALEIVLQSVRGLGIVKKDAPLRAQLGDWSGQQSSSKSRQRTPRRRAWSLPEESWQSDDAGWASLRTDWDSPADALRIRHDLPHPQIDLVLQDVPFLRGGWEVCWRIGGKPLDVSPSWRCECWFSDAEVDYLELTQRFENPARMLVRQVLLNKQDSCLVLADSLRCPAQSHIECEVSLPLAGRFTWEEDRLTREAALASKELHVRLFPVAQPQLKVNRSAGRLEFEQGRLKLMHAGGADGLYVPLLIDWAPDRRLLPADWSQLTVAEAGRKLSDGEAVGYRLRVGKRQWLLYHQLQPSHTPRSVLGVHTVNETLFARIRPKGSVKELLLVEATGDAAGPGEA